MNRALVAFLLVSAPHAMAANPYDSPYSIILTDTAPSADIHLRPVIVNRVDGETAHFRNEAVVAPGPHKVTVDLPPRKGFHTATQSTFDLDTEPCTRYYVAAKLESSLGQGWSPVVRSRERIGECEKKFNIAGAK